MQSQLRAAEGRPHDSLPDQGPDVSVLATGQGVEIGMRLGARVFPLERWMSRQEAVVGAEVAVTAALADHLPASHTVVVVVAQDVDADTVVEPTLLAVAGMLGLNPPGAPVTVGVASPAPVRPGSADLLSMHCQHVDALPETIVDAVAVGRRCGLVTAQGNTVLLLRRFVPATATAVVHASPYRSVPARIDARWGVTETRSPTDTFEVPADGDTVHEKLAWQPTAPPDDRGGAGPVSVPVDQRHRYSIDRGTIRQLAAISRNAAVVAGRPLALDVALGERGPVVLRCRPSTD